MLDATGSDATGSDKGNARIMLDLLNSVERNGGQSQRRLGSELGIALGLVNAYLKRCVKKGLIKVTHAPARRYIYYLTPQGFAEKSRLTVEYLSRSFSFFRQAKADCGAALKSGADRGFTRLVLAGISDLAEIAMLCAPEHGVTVVAVVDGAATRTHFVGVPVVAAFEAVAGRFDAVLVTDMQATAETFARAVACAGRERVLVPTLLDLLRQPARETKAQETKAQETKAQEAKSQATKPREAKPGGAKAHDAIAAETRPSPPGSREALP